MSLESKEKLRILVKSAMDKKAENPVVLDLRELTTLTDFFVIFTGSSDVHCRTIADSVEDSLKKAGILPVHVEGYENAQWILLDYGDVIVHVFREETRKMYDLESLWLDAERIEVEKIVGGEF